jgi:hypothetical protein
MFTRKNIVWAGLVGLFIAQTASAQPASAQPRWGRAGQPQNGACFYKDADFRGQYFCVRPGEQLRSLPSGMGDKISSVRLLGASEVTVFRDKEMRGRSGRFITSVSDLKREGWGDQISSVDVERARDYSSYGNNGNNGYSRNGQARGQDRAQDRSAWRNSNPQWGRNDGSVRDGACFYEDADFRGESFCVPRGATYTALPRGFNDRISSVRVFGDADVRIFQDDNFRGRSAEIRNDTPNLRGNWRDKVSSIRVF